MSTHDSSTQTVLVTGVNGFVGEHLVRELNEAGHTVIGAGIQPALNQPITTLVEHYEVCDLTDNSNVDKLPWKDIDSVIHLAGLSAVGPSFDQPQQYMNINTGVLTGLFEGALRAGDKRPRIVSVSSGSVYAPSDEPLTEESKTIVGSPYSASKLASEIVLEYYRNRGFDTSVNVRPFNHVGPGQGPGFLVPDIAAQLKDVVKNGVIQVGNIKTARDYTDVRDVVRAYRLLVEAPKLQFDLYNICSSNPATGVEVLETLKKAMGREDVTIEIDQNKVRPTDVMYVCGSHERLSQDTGWQPEISLEKTLQDVAESL